MRYALFDTAFGTCGIVWTDAGIVRFLLPERSRSRLMSRITELGDVSEAKPPKEIRAVVGRVKQQLRGKPGRPLEAPLDLSHVTPFTRRIYEALCLVPPGQTVSYGELAARAGSPKAARAVGRAMAVNPMPILIPCHRVIGKDGKPVGFTAYGGLATKAKLLALEGVEIEAGDALRFDVDKACRHLRRVDPELGAVMKRVGQPRLSLEPGRNTFAALAEAIVYQQLTGRAAATIFRRVRELFGKRRTLRAEDIAGASEETLRSAGLSRAKATAMHDLARKQLAGDVPSFRKLDGMSDEAIIDKLTAVRGVGRWTVEMLLIFRLGRPDVLAVGDYALRKAFSQTYGLDEVATPKAFAAHGERWRPYRTMACWYLWRSLELD